MQTNDATVEWTVLQNQFDSYEKYSLLIKLTAITLFVLCIINALFVAIIVLVILALWLQDAIWKTFQARIETRLLRIEAFFANEETADSAIQKPFQLNREYQASRGGFVALCGEYIRQAVRPTVAFPYIFLIVLTVIG
ncbi:MAG: hypothetical protein AB8C02_01105 [Halioglobus sp.]